MPDNKQCPSVGSNVYVGARYVPKFDGEWDATKAYEPLTIVTWKGDSYTSRTWVAPGIEPSDEKYWAQTGNYNAQIEEYRQLVLQYDQRIKDNADAILENEELINENINDIAEINQRLNRKQKWIFIGDSYANPAYGGWPRELGKKLGLTENVDFWVVSDTGYGFLSQWQSLLETWVTEHPSDAPEIDNVLVVGGANDCSTTKEGIPANTAALVDAMNNFREYCQNNLPKAKIMLSYQGRSRPGGYTSRLPEAMAEVQRVWSDTSLHGMLYLTGAESVLWRKGAMADYGDTDYLHPSPAGGKMITDGLYNILTTGNNCVTVSDTLTITGENIRQVIPGSYGLASNVTGLRMSFCAQNYVIAFTSPQTISGNLVRVGSWSAPQQNIDYQVELWGNALVHSTTEPYAQLGVGALFLTPLGDVYMSFLVPKDLTTSITYDIHDIYFFDLQANYTIWGTK